MSFKCEAKLIVLIDNLFLERGHFGPPTLSGDILGGDILGGDIRVGDILYPLTLCGDILGGYLFIQLIFMQCVSGQYYLFVNIVYKQG